MKLPSIREMLNGTLDANNALSDIYSPVRRVTSRLGNDVEKLGQFIECIKLFEVELDSTNIRESSRNRRDTIESFLGVTQPDEVPVKTS